MPLNIFIYLYVNLLKNNIKMALFKEISLCCCGLLLISKKYSEMRFLFCDNHFSFTESEFRFWTDNVTWRINKIRILLLILAGHKSPSFKSKCSNIVFLMYGEKKEISFFGNDVLTFFVHCPKKKTPLHITIISGWYWLHKEENYTYIHRVSTLKLLPRVFPLCKFLDNSV